MDTVKLFNDAELARQYLEMVASRNTYGLSPEERVDLDIQYRRAQDNWQQKYLAYQDAIAADANE